MKHLRLLYGIDDKFEIVNHTLEVCRGYFDSIKVVNSGVAGLVDKLKHHTHVVFEDMNWFTGDQEPYRRAFYYDVPENDWVLWLDADERPTQALLDNLQVVIAGAEAGGYYNVRIPFNSHNWGRNAEGVSVIDRYWEHPGRGIPPSKEEFGKFSALPPMHDRMFRRTKKTCSSTNFGGHGYIIGNRETANDFDNPHWFYSPYALNHYKDEVETYQSFVLHNFTTPCRNTSYKDAAKIVGESAAQQLIKEFQLRERVFTSNELVVRAKTDPAFSERLKALYSDPRMDQNIDSVHYHLYKTFATKFNVSFENVPHHCGSSCCSYKSVQL